MEAKSEQFQGGAFDHWAGPGFEKCADLLNHEFERVFYKNNFGAGLTIFNIYMASNQKSRHEEGTD